MTYSLSCPARPAIGFGDDETEETLEPIGLLKRGTPKETVELLANPGFLRVRVNARRRRTSRDLPSGSLNNTHNRPF